MLILTRFQPAKKLLEKGFLGLMLYIDGLVYRFASLLYQMFYKLAGAQILDNNVYETIAEKVYLFIGVIALFVVSISLLKSIVNPDELNKSVIKSFKTLITSVILIILMPTIFSYAFSVQSAIFEDKIIDQIFNFNLYKNSKKVSDNYGQNVNKICNLSENKEVSINIGDSNGSRASESIEVSNNTCRSNYMILTVLEGFFSPDSKDVENEYATKYSTSREYMIYSGNFNYIGTYSDNVVSKEDGNGIGYAPIISTAAGIFLCYIILSFCIDLGVRCVKLAFYELIAPIPILMRLIPKKEGQFNKWVSQTVSCFLEVFSRVLILTFVMFIARNLVVILDNINLGQDLNLLGKAIILLGMFTFAKQAPKLLKDALGIDGGDLSLGIKKKLTSVPVAGRAFTAGYGVANKMQGAATGALGAGYSARVNGASFLSGAKYGAAAGWKKGGHQFNAQRQGIYSDVGMGKGKASWFGGQAYMDKALDDVRNTYRDNYQDHVRPQAITKIRESDKWKSFRDEEYTKLEAEHQKILEGYEKEKAQYEKEYSMIELKRDSEIKQVSDNYNAEISKWEAKRGTTNIPNDMIDNEINQLKTKLGNRVSEIQNKYNAEIQNKKAANAITIKELNEKIQAEKNLLDPNSTTAVRKYIDEKGKVSEEPINALELKARENADAKMGDIDETFKYNLSQYKKRIYEKEISKSKNTLEGQKQIAFLEEAFKNINKNNGSAPSGGPAAATQNKGNPSDGGKK